LGVAGGGITLTYRCSNQESGGKERLMTEERRTGSGGTEDNVRDELDEATKRDKPEESHQGGRRGGREDRRIRRGEGQRPGRVGRVAAALNSGQG
jgi:hypothetical protein